MAYWLLFFLITIAALAWLRASIRTTSLVFGSVTLFYGLFGQSWLVFLLLLIVGVVVLLPLNLPVLRQEWISRPLFGGFKRVLARLDERQLAALSAAGTGWEAELFDGQPNWTRFHEDYSARLTPDERALLEGPVAEFCSRYARDPGTPTASARLRAYGLHGLSIQSLHGGRGVSALGQAAALGWLSAGAGSALARKVGSSSRLSWIEALQRYGTPAQQSRWLGLLADGAVLQSIETGIAGDAVVEAPDGDAASEGPVLRVDLDIRLQDDAEIVGVCVDVRDPGGRLGPGALGATWLLLPAADLKAGQRGLRVPFDAVLGGREHIGRGARNGSESRSVADAIAPIAIHAGSTTALALAAGSAAKLRVPFGESLSDRALAEAPLATLAAVAYSAQALSNATARAVDLGEKPFAAAAFARTLRLTQSRECAAAARDLGLDHSVLAKLIADLDIPADDDLEPTLLARPDVYSACVLRSHGAFMQALAAANAPNPAEALTRFDDALWTHVGHLFGTGAQALALGLTAGSSLFGSNTLESRMMRRINRYSAALAFAADVSLSLLATELGSKQTYTALRGLRELSRRSLTTWLGDALAQLYLASVALRQFDEGGAHADERATLTLICTDAFSACEEALDKLLRHLSSPTLAWLTRRVILPLGHSRRAPAEMTQRTVAAQLQNDGRLRERLGSRAGLPADASPWPLVDTALRLGREAEAIEARAAAANRQRPPRFAPARIEQAQMLGAIDDAEAAALHAWLAAVGRVQTTPTA